MRTIIIAVAFLSAFFNGFAASSTNESSSYRLIDLGKITVDLKAIAEDKGDFGLDYKLSLTQEDIPLPKPEWLHTWEASLKSVGFITLDDDENELNSIVSELSLAAVYRKAPSGGNGDGNIEDVLRGTNDLQQARAISRGDRRFRAPLWVHLDAHGKHETTQDFRDYDFAFGAGAIVETRYLNPILDLPFRFLRWGKDADQNNPRFLDAAAGYDYVFALDQTANEALRDGKNEAHRIYTKVEWETGIFLRQRFAISYNAHFEIDAPAAIRAADKDINDFLQVRVDLLRWNPANDLNASVSVKYTTGELPPNYTTGHVLGAGFSLEF